MRLDPGTFDVRTWLIGGGPEDKSYDCPAL
jgi:hypothetical protein